MAVSGCGTGGLGNDVVNEETSAEAGELETSAGQEPEEEAEEEAESIAEAPEVSGYTLESSSKSGILQSDIYTYNHEKSGAKLVCIDNDDEELAFGIFFRTPVVDETDTNHVFEHAIIASSEKYPSKDLFFDLANKSYNTFINAFTYDIFTGYPLSSKSEEQLKLLMDAYMSCMVAPYILTNENFFKREALRYELTDPEAPITMTGTVYSEDFSFLTNVTNEALNNISDALYPGEYASNLIGRAHMNYKDLNYENTLATYERCYHFDNSLILLYGDMDFPGMMEFLDSEYLSKAENNGTDLSEYFSQETEDGYVETVVPCPAFEGDTAENASVINYAVSLNDLDFEELTYWDLLSKVLNQENSPYIRNLREAGINNPGDVWLNITAMKPSIVFSIYNADKEQASAFKSSIDKTLKEMSEDGVEKDMLDSVLKQTEISNYQVRDQANAGVNIFPNIVNYWCHTGDTDYYSVYERALDSFVKDGEQTIIKNIAKEALTPSRSALVTTVPTPGLAEEYIEEREQYLRDMKAGMSGEEIEELIAETEEFNEWNALHDSNNDFVIDPSQIADAEVYDDYKLSEEDGIAFYTAPAEVESIAGNVLYLNAERLSEVREKLLTKDKLIFASAGPEENFDGYILNSIGYVGEVSGVLKKPIDAIDKEITGYDAGKAVELINDIKNADLEDKEAATEWLGRITASAGICTVGNADVPEADASGYDKVISYRAETQ